MMRPLLLAVLFFSCFSLAGQGVLQTNFVRNDASISRNRLDSVASVVSQAWNRFVGHASLMNPVTREVDDEAIDAFKKHFTFNAKIYNDLLENPVVIHHSDYVSQVFRRLPKEGVRGWFEEASLLRVSYDAAGFYRAEVSARKVVLNGIGLLKQSENANARRCFELKFRFEIPSEKLNEALISGIDGVPCGAEKGQSSASVSVAAAGQLSFPFFGFKLADSRIPKEVVSFSSRPSPAGGAYLRTRLGPASRWDAGLGLLLTNLEINVSLAGLKVTHPETKTTVLDLTSFEETARIAYWELPLGLHYRLSESEKWLWSADVFAVTTIRWDSYYDRRTYELAFPKLGTTAANIADADFWTFFSTRFGVSGRYAFSEKLGLELGAAFTAGISPLFGHQPRNDFFLDEPQNIASEGMKFFDSYLESLHANALNLRVGVVYNFD